MGHSAEVPQYFKICQYQTILNTLRYRRKCISTHQAKTARNRLKRNLACAGAKRVTDKFRLSRLKRTHAGNPNTARVLATPGKADVVPKILAPLLQSICAAEMDLARHRGKIGATRTQWSQHT